jgi:HK97 family phage prohead protease
MIVHFKDNKEFRTLRSADFGGIQFRESKDGKSRSIAGTAIVFNSESEIFYHTDDGKEVREIIAPGALDEVLSSNPDVRALADHDSSKVLGRTKSGTLRLNKTDTGIDIEIDAPDTQLARDLEVSIKRGDIDGMSFGFLPDFESVEFKEIGNKIIRVINKITQIFEVSVVAFPVYPATSVEARSLSDFKRFLEAKAISERNDNLINLGAVKRRLELTRNKIKLWKIS